MAAIPKNLTEQPPRSSAEVRALSHGRGGAGNIGSAPSDIEPPSLDTPTLKSDVYTTGRGGSGNMAKNNDPDAARRAQDVVAYVYLSPLTFSCSFFVLFCAILLSFAITIFWEMRGFFLAY